MWFAAWSLLLTSEAVALTSHQSGPGLDLGAGLGVRGTPVLPSVGGHVSAGWWFGVYDDQYAFGKYTWLGATGRVDWHPDALGVTPMLELRRGLELFVVGVAPYLAGGVTIAVPAAGDPPPLGYTARTGLMAEFRRSRFWSVSMRLEAGVDFTDGAFSPAGALLFGAAWSRPSGAIHAPEVGSARGARKSQSDGHGRARVRCR